MERPRRRSSRSPASRRLSRSPVSRRYSPRRRSRTRTRSRSLEKRTRKRSPFINELARQLRNEAGANTSGYVPSATMEGIAPLLNLPYQQEVEARPPPPPTQPPPLPPPPPPVASPYVHQSGPLPPPPPPPSSSSAMLPPSGPFMNFEPMSATVPLMNFEPMSSTPLPPNLTPANYSSGPVMYNQPNAAIQAPSPSVMCSPLLPMSSPQPVPPPSMDRTHISYNPSYTVPFQQSSIRQFEPPNKPMNHSTMPSTSSQSYTEHGPTASSYNEAYSPQQERIKTPEPPIISKPKVIAIHTIVMSIWF